MNSEYEDLTLADSFWMVVLPNALFMLVIAALAAIDTLVKL